MKNKNLQSLRGIALPLVLLVAVVALSAAVSTATIASFSGRKSTTQERRASEALLAAESGLNTLVALSRASATRYTGGSVDTWLGAEDSPLRTRAIGNGASYSLEVFTTADPNTVTVRSTGFAAGESRRVVIQDYRLGAAGGDGLFANAAVITQETFFIGGNASLIGRSSDLGEWQWQNQPLGNVLTGEYFTLGLGGVTYKVFDDTVTPVLDAEGDVIGGTVEVVDIGDPDDPPTVIAMAVSEPVTHTPFAVAEVGGLDPATTTFTVSNTSLYKPDTFLYIGDGIAKIDSIDYDTNEVVVTWQPPMTAAAPEGTPIRLKVPSVIYDNPDDLENPCSVQGSGELPQGCVQSDLTGLWEKTFGTITKDEMLGFATCDTTIINDPKWDEDEDGVSDLPFLDADGGCTPGYFGPDAAAEWPASRVTGVTWVDEASTGNFQSRGGGKKSDDVTGRGICGDGVVILNTGVYAGTGESGTESINLNVDDCEFSGILYILGDVGINGNLDKFSGTIIIETPDETRVAGTNTKSTYDPLAIRSALSVLPDRGTGAPLIFGAVDGTFRYGQ